MRRKLISNLFLIRDFLLPLINGRIDGITEKCEITKCNSKYI